MKKIKLIIISILLYGIVSAQESQDKYSPENQLDINSATLEQIQKLPVTREIAKKLYNRILYKGDFGSIYQLLDIEGMC